MESRNDENRQEISELLIEFKSTREQLRVAKVEYGNRFRELVARLLLQTRTWRSLHIYKRRLAIEISSLQRQCNEMFEEFVKLETLRNEKQQDYTRHLSETPESDGIARAGILRNLNEFNRQELSEGLSLRWELLDRIEAGVEEVEAFVQALQRKKRRREA